MQYRTFLKLRTRAAQNLSCPSHEHCPHQSYFSPPPVQGMRDFPLRQRPARLVVHHVGHQPREVSLLHVIQQDIDAKIWSEIELDQIERGERLRFFL